MTDRQESFILHGISKPFRILHLSDIHFSVNTSHEKNQQISDALIRRADFWLQLSHRPGMIAVTGDLISRDPGEYGIPDAVRLLCRLRKTAPVAYSLGNHEIDIPETLLSDMLTKLRKAGILVLDNQSAVIQDILFTGLTLPSSVFRTPEGSYSHLMPITETLMQKCIGSCNSHPCILLAHSPMGFQAYAGWGADLILSGHVHGGVIRVPGIGGILSPERRFFPKYTKGVYRMGNSIMNVSAGIGKLRVNNPAECICIDLLPEVKKT